MSLAPIKQEPHPGPATTMTMTMTMTMTIAMITRMATITHMATTAMTMTMTMTTTTTINMFTPRTAAAHGAAVPLTAATAAASTLQAGPGQLLARLRIGQMDCPTEETLIRKKLGGLDGVRAGLQPDAARADRGSRRRRAGAHHGRHQVAGHDARAAGRERAAPARARRQARELVGHRRRRPDGRAVRVLAFRRLVRLRHRRAGRGRHPGLRPDTYRRAGSPCATAISTSTP